MEASSIKMIYYNYNYHHHHHHHYYYFSQNVEDKDVMIKNNNHWLIVMVPHEGNLQHF